MTLQFCNHDCFNCPFPDCIDESLTLDELKESQEREKTVRSEHRGTKKRKRNVTDRYRVMHWWYYQQHPEKRRAEGRKWREENREYNKARKHAYYVANLERITVQQRQYRELHREELREYFRKRYKENKEQIRDYHRAHRDEISARKREYYYAHHDAELERAREYRRAHRDEINARARERRRQKRLAAQQNQPETPST